MSEEICITMPKAFIEALKRRAERAGLKLEELIVRALIREIEEELTSKGT